MDGSHRPERGRALGVGLRSRRDVLRAAVLGGVATSLAAGSGAAASTRHRFAAQRRASSAGGPGAVRVLWQAGVAQRLFALTFDDGPSSAYTTRLLDVLGELQVPATFFCVGRAARAHPELVARASAEGHEIGNHSDTHVNLGTASADQTRAELVSCQRTLTELTGRRPALVRPPYGAVSGAVLRVTAELGCHLALWSFALDEEGRTTADVVEQARSRLSPGGILLAHDAGDLRRQVGMDAVPYIVQLARDAGYRMATVSELLTQHRDERP